MYLVPVLMGVDRISAMAGETPGGQRTSQLELGQDSNINQVQTIGDKKKEQAEKQRQE